VTTRARQPRRRDRRGRGLRGDVFPADVPAYRTFAERFDDLVIDAAERLSRRWPQEMEAIEVAVEDVPHAEGATWVTGVPLGRVVPATGQGGARIVVHRRAVMARAEEELPQLVYLVLVEQLAVALGRSPRDIDPDADLGAY